MSQNMAIEQTPDYGVHATNMHSAIRQHVKTQGGLRVGSKLGTMGVTQHSFSVLQNGVAVTDGN